MILNLRGTHGSGKSTLVQQFRKTYGSATVVNLEGGYDNTSGKKVYGYRVPIPGLRKQLLIVGPYATQCGGADAIQPYADIWPIVEAFAKLGHVIFEGALVSSCVGSLGEELIKRRRTVVVGYLDTPLETCLQRIQERRAKKGVLTPLNPKNTTAKFESIQRTRTKFEAAGVKCITLNHKKAFQQLLEVLLGDSKTTKSST